MKIKLSKQQLRFVILLLPIMEPGIFKNEGYGNIDTVYTILKLIAYSFLVLLVIKKKKLSPLCASVMLYEGIILSSTIINGNGWQGFRTYAGPALATVGICVLFDIFDNYFECIYVIRNLLFIYIIINLITFFLAIVGSGMSLVELQNVNLNCFLGEDNRYVFYFMPGILFSFLLYQLRKYESDKMIFWFILWQSFGVLVIRWSVGAMIVLTLLVLYFLFFHRLILKTKGTVLNCYVLISTFIGINLFFVFGMNFARVNLLEIAERFFSKSGTLDIRFRMWMNVLKVARNSPLLGIGVQNADSLDMLFHYVHAHNLFFNILLRGGILGIVSFIAVLFIATKPVWDIRNSYVGKTIAVMLFGCLILSLADSYDDVYFYMLLAASYNMKKIYSMCMQNTE